MSHCRLCGGRCGGLDADSGNGICAACVEKFPRDQVPKTLLAKVDAFCGQPTKSKLADDEGVENGAV